MEPCVICGNKGNTRYSGNPYCKKHYNQMYKYGYTLDHTRFDENEIITYDNYSEILLYDCKNREIARTIIDTEDIPLLKQYRWSLSKPSGCNPRAYCGTYDVTIPDILLNKEDNQCFSYVNKNPLDCRKINLVVANEIIKSQNKAISKSNTSGYKGVHWYNNKNKWVAYIKANGCRIHLGYFDKLEDAVAVRKAAEAKYFTKLEDLTNV